MLVGRLNYATRGILRCGGAVALANNAAAPLATAGVGTMATANGDSAVLTGISRRVARFPSSVQISRGALSSPVRRAFSTGGKKVIPFVLADIGEGIAEVELLQWFVSEGDSVHQFDNICEVQSDKATVEISSRYDGVVKNIHFTVGDMVQVGSALVDIEIDAEEGDDDAAPAAKADDAAKPAAVAPAAAAAPVAVAPEPVATNREILTTPAVRKIAKENAVDLAHVPGTGPNGRILKADILSFIADGGAAPAPAATAAAAAAAAAPELPSAAAPAPPTPSKALPSRGVLAPNSSRTEQVSGIQRIMVRSMKESLRIPHFTYSEELSFDEMVSLRASLKDAASGYGIRLSYLPILIKAVSIALADHEILNSSLSDDESTITYHGDHNIGVAMDTPRGLLVPCVKQVQNLSIFEVAQALNELQALGAAGKLGEEHLTGGTITVSNMGSIGGTYMSPVIMAPQTAIVALGRIQTVPRIGDDGSVASSKIMTASWAGDHRIIDGAAMARFCNHWRALIESPQLMLAHLK